jgi:diguanylate cyclase (GGDEF)-like protein
MRRVLERIGPRDARLAARSAIAMSLAALAIALVSTVLQPETSLPPWIITIPLVAVAVLSFIGLRAPEPWPTIVALVIPLFGIVLLVVMDIASRDATMAGQLFFFLPVLYGAVLLRTPGAVLMTVGSVIGEALVVFTVLPPAKAMNDLLFLTAVLVTMTMLLARAADRQAELVARLRELADVDQLTGLASRHALEASLHTAVTSTRSEHGLALILVDLDHFKSVNDEHGHPTGDAALRHVARQIQRLSRGHDTSARLGGDELALLMPGCPLEIAVERAEQIAQSVRTSAVDIGEGRTIPLTVSVGVAHMPTHADSVETLYRAADNALYEAKQGGRDRVGLVPAPRSAPDPLKPPAAPGAAREPGQRPPTPSSLSSQPR